MNDKNRAVAVKEIQCKNCDTVFIGNYCPNCGQSIKDFERPFGFLFFDLMGNIFAFDTRFWKTFKAVLFKPGTLSMEYVKGHRVRYMPPFRFYVFVSFVFFMLLNINVSTKMKSKRENLSNNLSASEGSVNSDSAKIEVGVLDINFFDAKVVDSLSEGRSVGNESVENSSNSIDIERISRYPEVYVARMFKYLSWTVFILMPFYGFLLWMFFRKSQEFYITHLVLAINQHSFVFVIFLVITLLAYIVPGDLSKYGNIILLLIPVYTFIGYSRLYRQDWWKILLKFTGVGMLYSIVLVVVLILATMFAFEVNPLV